MMKIFCNDLTNYTYINCTANITTQILAVLDIAQNIICCCLKLISIHQKLILSPWWTENPLMNLGNKFYTIQGVNWMKWKEDNFFYFLFIFQVIKKFDIASYYR